MTLFDDILCFCSSFTILDSPFTVCFRSGNFIRSSFIFDVVSTFCIIILSTVVCCRVGAALVSFYSAFFSFTFGEMSSVFRALAKLYSVGCDERIKKTKSRQTENQILPSLSLFRIHYLFTFVHSAPRIKQYTISNRKLNEWEKNKSETELHRECELCLVFAMRVTSVQATN